MKRLTLLLTLCIPTFAATPPRTPADLPQNSRELFADMMRLADRTFDPSTHLVTYPSSNPTPRQIVRETSWYAAGLLLRDGPGDSNKPSDRATAAAALDAVLNQQYLDPATQWFGTFRRTPSEPLPPPNARDFDQFDPNWRVFIGTTFEIILADFPDRIPAALADRLYRSIDLAVQGEKQEGRLHPTYTNPALMYGALWDFAAAHHHDRAAQAEAAAWNDSVYALFKQHNAFNEYNSPTYYGTDLYGLALWRLFGSTPKMRSAGAGMEAILWTDIADFYHPNLRNIAGPYDRSYGMDMETYTALTGLWIRTVLPADKAPLPPIDDRLDHSLDDWFVPLVVLLGSPVPPPALARLQHFAGPHQVTRALPDDRTATAWIGEDVLFGAEFTHQTLSVQDHSQFHPATVQWRTPSGPIGWINITECPKIDATASKNGISIQTGGTITLRIFAPGVKSTEITSTHWPLPGLTLDITTDAATFSAKPTGPFLDLTYTNLTHMNLSKRR